MMFISNSFPYDFAYSAQNRVYLIMIFIEKAIHFMCHKFMVNTEF